MRGDADTQEAPARGAQPLDAAPASAIRAVAAAGCADLLRRGDLLGGKYEIRSKIGEGGMGQVYEALDRALARRVAIKVARASTTTSLAREARALAALRHPSIVSVFALEEHEGMPYVVMELLFGRTLEAVLDECRAHRTSLPMDEALDLLAAVADGLAAVHRGGMAHRDVKPANVMLAPGGRVVLTDFGIFQPEAWRGASLAGSPHYIAPEIVQGRVGMGELYLADVYALGIVAYEALTGRVPFDDPNVFKILLKHTSDPVPDPALQRDDVPERLAALVLDMLAKDPRGRPQSMDEIAWQLRRLRTLQPARGDHRCSVVIAEDNPATGAILTSLVSDALHDADVRIAQDGESALRMVRRRPPDLLIVDLDLPSLDGVALCEQLRGSPIARKSTILATSSHATAHQMARLNALGFVTFVPKGEELTERLPGIVKHARRAGGG